MLGGERATGKCRVDKKGNVEEEAQKNKDGLGRGRRGEGGRVKAGGWKIERGWYSEGLSVRIIFTEKEEKEEEEEEKMEEEMEEETLPLFDVAGETKNGG